MKTLYTVLIILSFTTLARAQEDTTNFSDCTVEGQKYLNLVVDQLEKKNQGNCSRTISYNSPRKLTAQVVCSDEKGGPQATGIIRLRCGGTGVTVFESRFTSK